jgi:hypothetical protein
MTAMNFYKIISILIFITLPIAIVARPQEEEEDPEIDVPLTEVESDEPYIYEGGLVIEVGDTMVSQHEYEEFVSPEDVINFAYSFLGTPYVWGTKGPHTFDCSGFTSYVYRYFGFPITSASRWQVNEGVAVKDGDIRPGDLMFFGGRSTPRSVGHVGMCIEVDKATKKIKFIHASTKRGVVINTYPDDSYYYKRFICARRIITDKSLMESVDQVPN